MDEFYLDKDNKLRVVNSLESSLDNIKYIVEKKDSEIKYLKNKVKELENEHFKDNELKEMQNKLDKMREDCNRGFIITEEEKKSIEDWSNKHIKKKHWDKKNNCPKSQGAIGGLFTYEFIPTSIGVIGTIKCGCGAEFCFCEMS